MNRIYPRFVSNVKRCLPWAVLALSCAILLCDSLFFFSGRKVDESEVVLNAVAIAAGSWSPEWPGYGHLAMYIPAAVLSLLALLLTAVGSASTYANGIYLLFQDDAVYQVTRLLYTLIDVATGLIFARVIAEITGQRIIAALFFVYFLFSPDTWQYANYIRTDTVVSFFTAVAAYVLTCNQNRYTPVAVGVAIGAAIACKYSAAGYVALVALFLLPQGDDNKSPSISHRIGVAAMAGTIAIISAVALQPRYNFGGMVAQAATHLSGSKFAQEAVPLDERLIHLWGMILQLEPLAGVFLVTMWASIIRGRRSAAIVLLVAIGIAPSIVSNFPRDYWLIPFADALRGAGWLGIACIVEWVSRRSRMALNGLLVVVAIATAAGVANRLPSLQKIRLDPHRITNAELSRRWLYVNVANRERLVYAYEKNFLLPRAYSFRHYGTAEDFSRVFIFKRENFDVLHDLFKRRFFGKEFAEFSSLTPVRSLWLRATVGEEKPIEPELCAGSQCFKPKRIACDAAARAAMGDCANYVWNMDKPELRMNLSQMELLLDPAVERFAVCWYDCAPGSLNHELHFEGRGKVPLTHLAGRLFAPADVMPLSRIRALPKDRRTFIVTTPSAYRGWMNGAQLTERERVKPSEAFSRLMDARLVQRFDRGAGAVIEVYQR